MRGPDGSRLLSSSISSSQTMAGLSASRLIAAIIAHSVSGQTVDRLQRRLFSMVFVVLSF
jgi:hypothetical protein